MTKRSWPLIFIFLGCVCMNGWGVRDSRVLIVESLVDGVFCAGADLKERVTMTPSQVSEFLYNLRQAFRELEVRAGWFCGEGV